jgi:hypothetical protein
MRDAARGDIDHGGTAILDGMQRILAHITLLNRAGTSARGPARRLRPTKSLACGERTRPEPSGDRSGQQEAAVRSTWTKSKASQPVTRVGAVTRGKWDALSIPPGSRTLASAELEDADHGSSRACGCGDMDPLALDLTTRVAPPPRPCSRRGKAWLGWAQRGGVEACGTIRMCVADEGLKERVEEGERTTLKEGQKRLETMNSLEASKDAAAATFWLPCVPLFFLLSRQLDLGRTDFDDSNTGNAEMFARLSCSSVFNSEVVGTPAQAAKPTRCVAGLRPTKFAFKYDYAVLDDVQSGSRGEQTFRCALSKLDMELRARR